ncbi:MAG TPA: hypothetical protein ENI05_04725 [Porticoccus sp.]|nr:hypothetical protein [Porticoccus sp.]
MPRLLNATAPLFKRLVIALLLALPCIANTQAAEEGLAVIVHPGTAVDSLTEEQVSRIFRAEQQFWPDNTRITLLIRAPVSQGRTMALEKIYQMSEQGFRKYWISKMFKAEVASGPRVMYSTGMAASLVTAVPGAILLVPSSNIPDNAKVLKIDGKLPGEEGYIYSM